MLTLNDGGEIGGLEGRSGGVAQVNGGRLGYTSLEDGSELNVADGYVSTIIGRSGSLTNISGGRIANVLTAESGSEVTINGGTMRILRAEAGSDVTLVGNEYFLNGVSTSASNVTLGQGDVLSGVLEDGSTFIFSDDASDEIQNVSLDRVAIGAASTDKIFLSDSNSPKGLRSGQHMVVLEGGLVNSDFSAIDARLDMESGLAGYGLKSSRSEINIAGGDLGRSTGRFGSSTFSTALSVMLGSEVNMTSGGVSGWIDVHDSSIDVSGGELRTGLRLYDGADASVTAARVGGLTAFSGSQLNISGGYFGSQFQSLDILTGASVAISGGALGEVDIASGTTLMQGNDFKLNGSEFTGNSITLGANDVFSGTLLDGSAFIFSAEDQDRLTDVSLERLAIPDIDASSIIIDSSVIGPGSIRDGQTLTLVDGGHMDSFLNAVDSTVSVQGGSAEMEIEILDSDFIISGGELFDLELFGESHAEIAGGSIRRVEAFSGSILEFVGGTVTDYTTANEGSSVEISTTGFGLITALDGSAVNFNGLEFFLDGEAIDGLTAGSSFLISERNVTLSGTMLDGSQFSVFLQTFGGSGPLDGNGFRNGAMLTVTQFAAVPEPGSIILVCSLGLVAATRRRRTTDVAPGVTC